MNAAVALVLTLFYFFFCLPSLFLALLKNSVFKSDTFLFSVRFEQMYGMPWRTTKWTGEIPTESLRDPRLRVPFLGPAIFKYSGVLQSIKTWTLVINLPYSYTFLCLGHLQGKLPLEAL